MPLDNIPTDALLAAAGMRQQPARRSSAPGSAVPRHGLRDYDEPFNDRINPATSMPLPPGPADFPVQQLPGTGQMTDSQRFDKMITLLERVLDELIRQNISATPIIRAIDVTDVGQTLDWSQFGQMDRLMLISLGADDVWLTFDVNGPAVIAGTSDNSFKILSNMSINLTHSSFQKVGLRCAAGKTATVQAIAWQTVAGNQAGAID